MKANMPSRKVLLIVGAVVLLSVWIQYGDAIPRVTDAFGSIPARPDGELPDIALYVGKSREAVDDAIGSYEKKEEVLDPVGATEPQWWYLLGGHGPTGSQSNLIVYVQWSVPWHRVTHVRVTADYQTDREPEPEDVLVAYGFDETRETPLMEGGTWSKDWSGTARRRSNGRWYDVSVSVDTLNKDYVIWIDWE